MQWRVSPGVRSSFLAMVFFINLHRGSSFSADWVLQPAGEVQTLRLLRRSPWIIPWKSTRPDLHLTALGFDRLSPGAGIACPCANWSLPRNLRESLSASRAVEAVRMLTTSFAMQGETWCWQGRRVDFTAPLSERWAVVFPVSGVCVCVCYSPPIPIVTSPISRPDIHLGEYNPAPIRLVFHDPPLAICSSHSRKR